MGCGGEEYSEPASGEAGPLTEQQRVLVRKELFHQNRKYMGEAVDPGVQGGPRGGGRGARSRLASRPFPSGWRLHPDKCMRRETTGTKGGSSHGAPFTPCRIYRFGHHGPFHVPKHLPGRISGHRLGPNGRQDGRGGRVGSDNGGFPQGGGGTKRCGDHHRGGHARRQGSGGGSRRRSGGRPARNDSD